MLIYGRNPVGEAFRAGKTAERIYFVKGERDARLSKLFSEAKDRRVPVEYVDRAVLDRLCGGGNHQGIAAQVSDFTYASLDDIFACAAERGEKLLAVLLDGITDPHNFGAIVRSAECFGAHGIIIPARRSVGVTDTVVKVASGATEHMLIAKVTNINDAIRELKERNVWVYACDFGGEAPKTVDLKDNTAIVVGSEGTGVHRLTRELCDGVITIPEYGKINSLNASVALLRRDSALRNGEAEEMNGYDKLTDNQLAAAAQQGDALAEGALVKRYADFAEGISRSYFLVGGDTDDVRQIALIALLEAVRSFDPSRGAEFKTYASTCIRNRLLDAVRSAGANKNSALNNSVSLDDETEDGGVAPGELVSPDTVARTASTSQKKRRRRSSKRCAKSWASRTSASSSCISRACRTKRSRKSSESPQKRWTTPFTTPRKRSRGS